MRNIFQGSLIIVLLTVLTACSVISDNTDNSSVTIPESSRVVSINLIQSNTSTEDSSELSIHSSAAASSSASSTKIISVAKSDLTSKTAATSVSKISIPAKTAIVFDDPDCEKLMRIYCGKATGPCYPEDFASFIKGRAPLSIHIDFYRNTTSIFNSGSESQYARINSIPKSFKALSSIRLEQVDLMIFFPAEKSDITYTFDMSWITKNSTLKGFSCRDTDEIKTKNPQQIKLINFNTLASCTNLQALWLWDCQGVDLESVSNLTNVSFLQLKNCNITSLSGLRDFSKLKDLYIAMNSVTDWTGIKNNNSITYLKLIQIPTDLDLETLHTLPNLDTLVLSNCSDSLSSEEVREFDLDGVSVEEYHTSSN